MKILFITSEMGWGGGEVWLSHIRQGLQSGGHESHVVCNPRSAFYRRTEHADSHVHGLQLSGDFNPITIVRLYKLIRKVGIDLVCVNMEKDLRLGGLAARGAGIPVVVSREVDVRLKDKRINRFFYNIVADAIMTNSHTTRNTMLISAPWLDPQRISVIWKGIDFTLYSAAQPAPLRKEFHLSPADFIVGFSGRIDEQKGIPTLLAAVRIVAVRDPSIKFILAGEGNLRAAVDEFRKENNLIGNLFPAGFRDDIPSFLKAIDLLVAPSYWEGFCYAAVEAMAAGKPVIASSASSFPEIILDGQTGVLVPPRSAEDLARAILDLRNDPARRERLGRAGATRVMEHFQSPTMVTKTVALFDQIIKAHGSSMKHMRRLPPPSSI